MNGWVVAALVLNAAIVVVAIVYATRFAGRSVVVGVELQLELQALPITAPDVYADSRLPLFSPEQMTRTEWRALLEAFDAARAVYLKELTAWRNGLPRTHGSLMHAKHNLDIARWRLTRFERDTGTGPGLDAPARR